MYFFIVHILVSYKRRRFNSKLFESDPATQQLYPDFAQVIFKSDGTLLGIGHFSCAPPSSHRSKLEETIQQFHDREGHSNAPKVQSKLTHAVTRKPWAPIVHPKRTWRR